MIMALLLLAASGANASIAGDFDRDGRQDRVQVLKDGDKYKLVLFRSFGDSMPIERGVPAPADFKLKKVNRENRGAVCQLASLSRYACDSGDVLQYGNDIESAMAVWNGQRFIVYRPQVAPVK